MAHLEDLPGLGFQVRDDVLARNDAQKLLLLDGPAAVLVDFVEHFLDLGVGDLELALVHEGLHFLLVWVSVSLISPEPSLSMVL